MKKRLNRKASVVLSRYVETLESRVLLTSTNHLAFLMQPTDATAGATLDPQVVVAIEDSSNKVVTSDSSSVTLSIDTGTGPDSGSLGGTLTVAASDGLATFDDLALDVAGSGSSAYKLTAKDGSLTSANSNSFNINPGAATQVAFDQNPTNVKAGATMSPAVTVDVEDKFENIVTSDSSTVTLTVATGPSKLPPKQTGKKVSSTPIPATLGGTVIVPVNSGVATFSDLELDTSGTYTLAAADGKLTGDASTGFTVSAGTASQVAFGTAPSATVAGATMTAVTAQVEDQFGNVVTSDSSSKVTIALVSSPADPSGGGTFQKTVASGVATFSDFSFDTAGSYTVSATDGSLAVATSPAFVISPAAAAELAFKQAPTGTTAGVAIAPAVSVMVEDQFGNLVPTNTSTVTAAISTEPDGAVLGGKATVAAVKGIATLPGLTLNTAGSYKLTMSDASLTVATSGTFTVAPGAAIKLAFKSQPTDTVAGVKVSPSVTVQVQDKFGNVVTGDSSTVALALGPGAGSASITGTASVAASSGVATFDNLKVNTAGAYTFAATDAKLTAAASSTFNVTAGDAAGVVVSAMPASVIAGATIPAVKVSVVDALGNVVTGDTSSVTLAIGTGTGPTGATLGGTLTEAAVAGVATFSDLSLTASDAGATAYKLKATDGELTAGLSGSFDVAAAAASQVVYKKGPTGVAAGATVSPAITVQVEDKFGNVVTTDHSNVVLAITTGPSHSAPKLIGKKVSSVPVNASITGTATVAAVNGLATFSNVSFNFAGSYTITASDGKLTPAVSDSFTIAPGAATQVVFGTGPVAAVAGATLTGITVQVEDAAGNVVATDSSSKVTLAIASGPDGASLGGTVKETAALGVSTFADLVLQKAGTYTLTATDGSLTSATSATFVISPAAAAQLVGMQAPNTFVAGAAISPAATMAVEDEFGNVVTTDKSKVTAALKTGPDGATLGGVTSATAVAGVATFAGLVLTTAGTYKLSFSDGSLDGLDTGFFNVVAAAPAKLAYGQAPAATTAGTKQSPAVTVDVEDKFGNIVKTDNSAVTLTIASSPLGGPVGGLATLHAVAGVATFSNLAFNVVGNYSLRASDAALTAATSAAFAISPAAANKVVFVSNPATEVAGVKIGPAVTVAVEDKYGNVVTTDTSGVTVAITDGTNPNGTTLGGTLTQNAAKGVASFGDLAITLVGRYRLTATDGSLTSSISNPFNVNPAAAAQLAFDSGPSDTVAGSAISPNVTVDVEDKFGNLVTTDKSKVTVAVGGPTGAKMTGTLTQTAVNGVATFNDLTPDTAGDSTLTASDLKLTAAKSDTFTVSAGTATKLLFSTAPATTNVAGVNLPAYTVSAVDAFGNVDTTFTNEIEVAAATSPDEGELTGTTGANAVKGVVTLGASKINVAGGYTLAATADGLTTATSGAITITPAAASKVVIGGAGIPTEMTAGVAISPAVTAQVEDAFGNVVTTDSSKVTIAVSTGPTGAAITGTATATAVKGVASFAGLSLKTAGTYKLSFTDGSLTTGLSGTFKVDPAAAAKLAFGQAPTGVAAAAKISPSITVDVEDAFGNIVTGDSSNVVVAVGTGVTGATLGGTLTQAASSGVATFDDLTLDKAGAYTLKMTDGSLTALTSSSFTITA